jgi:hypothetical protein
VSSIGHCSSLHRLAAELEEPVARLGATGWSVERLRVLLARAELRAWQVESDDPEAPGLVTGSCPLGSGRAMLALAHECPERVVAGSFVVARSIPLGPGRWVLLGRPRIVALHDAPRFERLLRSLRAPRGEFWRVHGGVLAQAAA